MKSPTELASRLAKQWQRTQLRVERLLSTASWPLCLPIGKPSAEQFSKQTARVQDHVQQWRQIEVGEVCWKEVKYQAGAEPILIPRKWCLRTPSEWVAATADSNVQAEFQALEQLVAHANPRYRELLVRDRTLWRNRELQDVISATRLADSLYPGIAEGRPLRLLNGLEVDTKFIERNTALLAHLLDQRYDGEASRQGLHAFLDAPDDKNHWLLVVPLADKLLPFKRQRVTAEELSQTSLPGTHVLVVENEQCLYHLPTLNNTVAILGAGLNLQWLESSVFSGKTVGYWGDMDSWGLLMLARARHYLPEINPILMTKADFAQHAAGSAVPEPTPAQETAPIGLTISEADFYCHLLQQQCGRLEQEFLPEPTVHQALLNWRERS